MEKKNIGLGVAALAAGAGVVALAAKNHKDHVKNEVKKAAATAPEQEYRNTERGKNEKNSKGIYYTNGNYEAFARPKKPQGVDEKSAYIVGSGLASLAAACFLVRDGQMPGDHIHILEAMDIAGGACDGIYDATRGYVMRGGREMENHFECLWDLFRSIPSIETPGVSVLDEYYWLNKEDPNYSLCRATEKQGKDAHTEGTIYGDQNHAPNGDAEVRTSGCWNLWKNIAKQDPSFGHPEKFCSDIAKTNWESATVTTLDDKIIPYIIDICKRDPRSGKVVTGGIVSCQDSSWLLSWTINRQGQFKEQDKNQVCVWVYGLFTDVPGDYIKKPMKECTGKEITEEWLYHLGVPTEKIGELAEHSAICVPTMMPYITAFFMPRTKGDRPDVIPDGCVNFAFLGQFAETPRDTVFTTEYSVRTAMEAVYGLLGVDRGVPEVWGSVYDIRELLDSSVKLMDGKSPLEISLPGPLNALKKPLLRVVKGTVIEKVLRDHNVIKEGMI